MKKELEKLTKEQLIAMIEKFEHYPSVTMDDDKCYILSYLEDESCTISEKEIAEYLLENGVKITKDNIHLYYKFMSKKVIGELPFKIEMTTSCNIAIRNNECNEYIDKKGNLYCLDDEDRPKSAKLRYAVEYCFSPTRNVDDIEEFGLDYGYFNTAKEANEYIKNTVLIPENI